MQLSIRPWTEADAPVIAEALNDAGVTDNLRDGLPTPYTEADARDYIAFAQTAGEGAYAFAIAEDGVAVGSIQLTRPAEYTPPHSGTGLLCRPPPLGRGYLYRGGEADMPLRL